jgi:hypothetical protein
MRQRMLPHETVGWPKRDFGERVLNGQLAQNRTFAESGAKVRIRPIAVVADGRDRSYR